MAVRTKAAAGEESRDMQENLGGAPITNVLCFCLCATSILQTVADFPFPFHWQILFTSAEQKCCAITDTTEFVTTSHRFSVVQARLKIIALPSI